MFEEREMPRFGLKLSAVAAAFALSGLAAQAQLVTYSPATGTTGSATLTATSVGSGLTASTLGGAGISPVVVGASPTAVFRANGFTNGATPSAASAYVFTISSAAGGTVDFTGTSFAFSGRYNVSGSNSGPTTFALLTDLSGTTTQVGSAVTASTTNSNYSIDLSSLGLVNLAAGQTYTFSLAGYNASNSGTNAFFDLSQTTTLGGNFVPVPEPVTVGLLATAGLGLVRLRRRFI